MMRSKRKMFWLMLLALGVSIVPCTAHAGFGAHFGFDMNAQDTYDLFNAQLHPGDTDVVSITCSEIDKPLLVGVHFSFNMLPLVDLELGMEGSFGKYSVVYESLENLGGDVDGFFDEDVALARVGIYATGKYNVIKMPLVKGYVGGGLGYHIMTPLLTEEFIKAETEGGNYDLDADELVKVLGDQAGIGMHLAFGVKGKPSFMPLSVYAEGRYYVLPENDYGDETNKFFTMVIGLDIGF
ncbi:MAG: hypothetical protein GY835_26695 [bacterium]|nr:hypothetical protein [bacterium]